LERLSFEEWDGTDPTALLGGNNAKRERKRRFSLEESGGGEYIWKYTIVTLGSPLYDISGMGYWR
jgi:hypothetical protein